MSAKKRVSVTVNANNFDKAKKSGLNVSKYFDEMLTLYLESFDMDRKNIYEELNKIDNARRSLNAKEKAIKMNYIHLFEDTTSKDTMKSEAYEELVLTGTFNEFKYKELKKATGFYKPQLHTLADYCKSYDYAHPERDDKIMFAESLDYLLRRFNEDNPSGKLQRQGGYL